MIGYFTIRPVGFVSKPSLTQVLCLAMGLGGMRDGYVYGCICMMSRNRWMSG